MSSRTLKEYNEGKMLALKFGNNPHMLALAMVQFAEREKVRVLNKYREAHGEPLLPTDPPYMPGNQKFEWVIDVRRSWVSETGRNYR